MKPIMFFSTYMQGAARFLKKMVPLFLFLLGTGGAGIAQVNVSLSLVPPYSTRLSDYASNPGKVILTLTNTSGRPLKVMLTASVTGIDNGVSIRTRPGYRPSRPVTLESGIPLLLNTDMLRDLFDVNNFVLQKITANDIVTKKGLPEGQYQFCVRVFDYDNPTTAYSGDAPAGCTIIRLTMLEPPYLLKPVNEEQIKGFQPQNIIFSWTLPAGAPPGTQYVFRIVEVPNAQTNANVAYNAKTQPPLFETITGNNVFIYGPAQPQLVPGRKYAWAVTALDKFAGGRQGTAFNNGGRSEVRSFVYHYNKTDLPPVIALKYPDDNASLPPLAGIAANNFYLKWNYTTTGSQFFYEDAFVVEVKPGQSKEQAVKENQRVNSTKEPSLQTMFSCNNCDGKTYAWYVTLNDAGKMYKSEIRTFTIGAQNNSLKKITEFDLCGFPVKIKQAGNITNTSGYIFSGSGTTSLYKGGPEISVKFENLTIEPLEAIGRGVDWKATSGTAVTDNFYKSKIKFSTHSNVGGELWFDVARINYTPAIKTHFDKTKKYFVQDEVYSSHKAVITGKFNWQTDYLYKDVSGEEKNVLYTDEVTASYDYEKKFEEKTPFYLHFLSGADMNIIHASSPANNTLKLVPVLYIIKGTQGLFNFSGYLDIKGPGVSTPNLLINFNDKKGLVFDADIKEYAIPVNKDKSVNASFNSVKADLRNFKVSIPTLLLKVAYKTSVFSFNYKKAVFNSYVGLYCMDSTVENGDMSISDFPVSLKSSSLRITDSRLQNFSLNGKLLVPFVNQQADLDFFANDEGVQDGYVEFHIGSTSTLYKNAGDACEFIPYSGALKNGRIEMHGDFIFSNNDVEKNVNIKNLTSPDFYVKGNGDVGIINGSWDGGALPYQQPGKYNGFSFTPTIMKISRTSNQYEIFLKGMLVLSDNLAGDQKGLPNFNTTVSFAIQPPAGSGGAAVVNDVYEEGINFSSSEVSAGVPPNGIIDLTAKFKYFDKDPVYGKGFMCLTGGSFGMEQPDKMSLSAKMIVARAPGGFNYWYVEAGQENVIQIPTGVLDVGIYGFTGRIYYKMKHAGTNINTDDYVPNKDGFIGVYGFTKLKTLTDDGVKFWGDVSFEVASTKSGLDYIKFRGNGTFISSGVGNAGMVNAHDCELNFGWNPKLIHGVFNVDVNFANMVTASASTGFDITPSSFVLWGEATGAKLFGKGSNDAKLFGFELTDAHANLYGDFKLIDIDKSFNFWVCDPYVKVRAGIQFDAYVNYSPFQFNGAGKLYGKVYVGGCRLHGSLGLNLNAQLMFPNPTCISAGISIETPIKDFSFDVGFKNGSIIFSKCY